MLRNNFSKEKIKEIRKNFYKKEKIDEYFSKQEKKNKTKQEELEKTQEEWEKKHYAKELKKVEKFLIKLEEDINRLEKHCYRDDNDLDYKGIRQIENLFDEVNKDYYKPIKIKGTFNNNYIQYENRGDKDKGLSVRKYLYMIMPDLENMINNHKTLMRDSNGIIKDDLFGEWEIQLTMQINFVSSLDPGKNRIMDSKGDNVEIIMGIGTEYIIEDLFEFGRKNER